MIGRIVFSAACTASLLAGGVHSASAQTLSRLLAPLEQRIAAHHGVVVLFARDLTTGESL
jgi:hypothetical protein